MKSYRVVIRRTTAQVAVVVVDVGDDEDSFTAEAMVEADLEAMTAGRWRMVPTETRITATSVK